MKFSKKIIETMIIGTLPFILASCGGGSVTSSSAQVTTTTIVNGVEVPPAPDSEENNATLAGIDTNNNGIRDDVDIKIAEEFGHDTENIIKIQKVAKLEQGIVDGTISQEDINEYVRLSACGYKIEDKGVYEKLMNTSERRRAYGFAFSDMEFYSPGEYDCES